MSQKLADHCGQLLARLADDAPRLWVLDGDLADSDGAIHFAERHPERFLMAGIAEQNMVSVAAGMASAGLSPWVFSFAAFLCYRAYDQIRVCLSQARQPVVLVGSHSGGASGRNGKTHAALNDLSLMLSLPHLQVFAPGDFGDVDLAVQTLTSSGLTTPAYLRMPRRPLTPADALPGISGPMRWLRPKAPITLVSTGIASHWALSTARHLEALGHEVGVLHCLQLAPPPPLREALAGVEQIFVIEDHHPHGGLASLLHRVALPAVVRSFGWPHDWSGKSGSDDDLRAAAGLSDQALAANIHQLLAHPAHSLTRR
jgi:transketolase